MTMEKDASDLRLEQTSVMAVALHSYRGTPSQVRVPDPTFLDTQNGGRPLKRLEEEKYNSTKP